MNITCNVVLLSLFISLCSASKQVTTRSVVNCWSRQVPDLVCINRLLSNNSLVSLTNRHSCWLRRFPVQTGDCWNVWVANFGLVPASVSSTVKINNISNVKTSKTTLKKVGRMTSVDWRSSFVLRFYYEKWRSNMRRLGRRFLFCVRWTETLLTVLHQHMGIRYNTTETRRGIFNCCAWGNR